MKVISSFVIVLVLGLCRLNFADEQGQNIRMAIGSMTVDFDDSLSGQGVTPGAFNTDCLFATPDITVDDFLSTCANSIISSYCAEFTTSGMYSNTEFMTQMKASITNYENLAKECGYTTDADIPLKASLDKMSQGQTC